MDYTQFDYQVKSYIDTGSVLDITRNVAPGGIAPIKSSALSLTGFAKIETSFTLVSTTLTFLETRFNPRWARGQKIELYLRNSLGVLTLHRTLRILDSYYSEDLSSETPRAILTLELGCLFALRESRYPSPGDVKIPILENRPDVLITNTVNYWLRTFNLPEITSLIGDYVPTQRIQTTGLYSGGSSIMEHIGKILYVNALCELWVDAQERSRIRQCNLAPTAIDLTLQRRDLVVHSRSQGERERVAGTVRVLGVSNFKSDYQDPPAANTSALQDGVRINERISVSTSATSRVVTKTGTAVIIGADNGKDELPGTNDDDPGIIGQYEEITSENFEGGFPEQANPNPVLPPIPGSPRWLGSTSYSLREQRENLETADPKDLLPLRTTKTIETKYLYRVTSARHQGVIVQGVEIERVIEVMKVLPEGLTTLKIEQVKIENWIYRSLGMYTYNVSIVRPGDKKNRRTSKNSSSVGESQPPATKFAPPLVVTEQVEMYGEALFQYPPDAPDNEHPRDYTVGAYLDNSRFAKLLAQQLGALLIGRNEAIELGFRPSDAWIADPKPLLTIALPYDNIEQDIYLLDVPILILADRSYLGGAGIWLGRRNIATGVITPPYALKRKIVGYGNKAIGYGTKVFEAG
jgi:hypothetical protein